VVHKGELGNLDCGPFYSFLSNVDVTIMNRFLALEAGMQGKVTISSATAVDVCVVPRRSNCLTATSCVKCSLATLLYFPQNV
jgi:hypothetical protein